MSKTAIWWIVVIVVAIVAIYFGYQWYQKNKTTTTSTPAGSITPAARMSTGMATSAHSIGTKIPTHVTIGGVIYTVPTNGRSVKVPGGYLCGNGCVYNSSSCMGTTTSCTN